MVEKETRKMLLMQDHLVMSVSDDKELSLLPDQRNAKTIFHSIKPHKYRGFFNYCTDLKIKRL